MYIVCKGLDARGEVLWVWLDEALFISSAMPAVIDDEILIPRILHAGGDHSIGRPANEGLIDIAAKFVPAVPPHGRGERKAVRLAFRARRTILRDTCARVHRA